MESRQNMKREIFIAGFWLAFSAALAYYVNSSFLSQLVGARRLGLVYVAAAAAGGGLILALTHCCWLENFGWRRLSRGLGLILAGSYLGLSFISLPAIQFALFISFVLSPFCRSSTNFSSNSVRELGCRPVLIFTKN